MQKFQYYVTTPDRSVKAVLGFFQTFPSVVSVYRISVMGGHCVRT